MKTLILYHNTIYGMQEQTRLIQSFKTVEISLGRATTAIIMRREA